MLTEAPSNNCSDCGLPLDPVYRNILVTIYPDGTARSSYVCFVCHAMSTAADTDYFLRLAKEHAERVRHVKRLKPGADYLND